MYKGIAAPQARIGLGTPAVAVDDQGDLHPLEVAVVSFDAVHASMHMIAEGVGDVDMLATHCELHQNLTRCR